MNPDNCTCEKTANGALVRVCTNCLTKAIRGKAIHDAECGRSDGTHTETCARINFPDPSES